MRKKIVWLSIAFLMLNTFNANAQYEKTDSLHKRWFIGSTVFLVGNLSPVNPPEFVQLNVGYRITGRDVISMEFITWKYEWPLGINPFYNNLYGTPEEKYPGYIRDYGVAIAYQRFFWKGLYAAVHLMPMKQVFVNEQGDKVGDGFHLFNSYRVGYHVKLFNDRFFIQPSLGLAGRPYHSEMPDGFKEKDNKWPKYTPEPGLHIGFNF